MMESRLSLRQLQVREPVNTGSAGVTARSSLQTSITESIVTRLKQGGIPPWKCPWNGTDEKSMPYNLTTGQAYTGINVLILWARALDKQFSRNAWLTFNQVRFLGGRVKKGEKAVSCVFYRPRVVEDSEDGEEESRTNGFVLNRFSLFNVEQTEGLDESVVAHVSPKSLEVCPLKTLLYIKDRLMVPLLYDSRSRAYYSRKDDYIVLPDSFHTEADHAATLAHELAHATGHPKRLDRFPKEGGDILGADVAEKSYAFEELVAEMTAAFTCAELKVDGQHEQHVSYINHWIAMFEDKPKTLFQAASLARKAHDYIMSTGQKSVLPRFGDLSPDLTHTPSL